MWNTEREVVLRTILYGVVVLFSFMTFVASAAQVSDLLGSNGPYNAVLAFGLLSLVFSVTMLIFYLLNLLSGRERPLRSGTTWIVEVSVIGVLILSLLISAACAARDYAAEGADEKYVATPVLGFFLMMTYIPLLVFVILARHYYFKASDSQPPSKKGFEDSAERIQTSVPAKPNQNSPMDPPPPEIIPTGAPAKSLADMDTIPF
mmetsp:Transcript_18100/g.37644  ORF Transcript_18100/g.37644 Transcript_18100/m.37644 type:complete len:205 (-) Transcript_18100:44-658(-)|eukprot:CAMPEP_0184681438 /NCGR_PEP_ID=MMETSP0312-20130426/4431_1 /TAXON_ID=31354 /ORGANISM="Compsopogon coeruleus, Strain SAG 36.94" /LENGTH=204 /DNA_ID=CAMNT_0027132295 /DNA_START=199 /DNA_END=813 /DNA_ORIENTATION=+